MGVAVAERAAGVGLFAVDGSVASAVAGFFNGVAASEGCRVFASGGGGELGIGFDWVGPGLDSAGVPASEDVVVLPLVADVVDDDLVEDVAAGGLGGGCVSDGIGAGACLAGGDAGGRRTGGRR